MKISDRWLSEYAELPESVCMTRNPCVNHDVEVMILARAGLSFTLISERCGGTIDRCKGVWYSLKTVADEDARLAAKGAKRVNAAPQLQPIVTGPRAPDHEVFSGNVFGEHDVDPIEYGKVAPPDDTRRSTTGCAAQMLVS